VTITLALGRDIQRQRREHRRWAAIDQERGEHRESEFAVVREGIEVCGLTLPSDGRPGVAVIGCMIF
jgi:hypothetical protein